MDLYNNFLYLIKNIEPFTLVLAFYGLVLLISGFIKSSYGVFYFSGTLILLCSVGLPFINGGNIAGLFIMIFFLLILITASYMMSVRFSKYGWIVRMPVSKVSEGVKEIRYYAIKNKSKNYKKL